jgi:glycosyltransferase involved in cell wall biosynthesis
VRRGISYVAMSRVRTSSSFPEEDSRGGIAARSEDGRSGVLLSEPRDLEQVGAAITALLTDRERRRQIGIAAQRRVQQQFLGPHHLGRYFEVMNRVAPNREHRLPAG